MKNNSFLIENFEEILLQKSFEDLNDAEKEQLKLEKISAQEYESMREMLLHMQEIEESEEIPNDAIKNRLMAEFATPTKVVAKNKIIPFNRWFYFGVAASLTLAFVFFYKLSENLTNSSENKVAQQIESPTSTNSPIQQEKNSDTPVSEVYTSALADTITRKSLTSVAESENLSDEQIEMQSPLAKSSERLTDSQKDFQPATRLEIVSLSEDAKYEADKNEKLTTFNGKKQQDMGVSLAEVSQLQNITVEIY